MKRLTSIFLVFFFQVLFLGGEPADVSKVIKDASALEKANKLNEALDLYQKALQKNPSEELYQKTGALLGKMKRYKDGEKLLDEAVQKFPSSNSLLNLLGFLKLKEGLPDEAKKLWEKVLEKDPQNAFAKEWIGKLPGSSQKKPIESADSNLPNSSSSSEGKSKGPLPIEEQEKLARKLYKQMAETDEWEVETFRSLHQQVIDSCPDTTWGPESCWKLSNLYLTCYDPPRKEDIVEILETLLKRYPKSSYTPPAQNRLLVMYKDTGNHAKVVEMYSETFKDKTQLSDQEFFPKALEYADSLSQTGKTSEANQLYEEILQRDKNQEQFESTVARSRLGK
ncbi:hypothetical protein HYY75_08245 [bacterium]|nr:hypothetical protein [bacterium]